MDSIEAQSDIELVKCFLDIIQNHSGCKMLFINLCKSSTDR